MKKILILAICCSLAACAPKGELTLIHFNDTHSHLDPLRDARGGVIERAAFIDSVRHADGASNVLLLHAGDFSQGSSYFTILEGQLEIDLINAMGYDCVCLGNHEFDNGIEALTGRLARLNCPVVCANYDFSPFELGEYVKPWAVIQKAGRKIGIIGLLTDLTRVVSKPVSDRIPHLGPEDEVVNAHARHLREEEGCDFIILLTHIGFTEDVELAARLRGVDLIVGGHSHTYIEKPEMVTDLDGEKIPVVQDGEWGLRAGIAHIKI